MNPSTVLGIISVVAFMASIPLARGDYWLPVICAATTALLGAWIEVYREWRRPHL